MDPKLTASEFLQALCIYREARGESMAAKAAILAVIRNRAADAQGRWPKTTSAVILQPAQFTSFSPNDPSVSVFPQPKTPGAWQAWLDCCEVVTSPMSEDPTGGATNYHSIPDDGYSYKNAKGEMVNLKPPTWADPAKLTLQIGKTRFYKL